MTTIPATNQNIATQPVKGLLPAVDRRGIGKPYCLDGQNFYVDIEGPYAGFGNTLLTYEQIAQPKRAKTFRTDDGEVIATADGFFTYDTVSMSYIPQYVFVDVFGLIGPWTMAHVANAYYFSNAGLGQVIKWLPSTNTWSRITDVSLPANPRAVCAALGRLVVLGSAYYAWSTLDAVPDDEGNIFTATLVTGAGFQGISLIGGSSLTVREIADGFLVFTTAGIAKAEYSATQAVFRHYPLARQFKAVNDSCIVSMDDFTHTFLDRKGLFSTYGKTPLGKTSPIQPVDELFNQYLTNKLLQQINLADDDIIAMDYHQDRKLLFLSLGAPNSEGLYTRAFVYEDSRKEWGLFNQLHTGIGEIDITTGPNVGYNFGYITDTGYVRLFHGEIFIETEPSNGLIYFYQQIAQYPARNQNDIWYMTSVAHITAVDEYTLFEAQELNSGMYDYDGASIAVYARPMSPLNAFIEIGPFRYTQQQFPDEISKVTDVIIGMGANNTGEDWMAMPDQTVDWLTDTTGDEDWGGGGPTEYTYRAQIRGSVDAETTWNNQLADLSQKEQDGKSIVYTTDNVGIFHNLIISAFSTGQGFHLKSQEISANMAGRL